MGANNSTQNLQGKDVVEVDAVYHKTPLSIGIADAYGRMFVIIPRNTRIPTKTKFHTTGYTTVYDNHESGTFAVYQGERRKASDNKLLGTLVLEGIQLGPMGVPKVRVCLDIDAKGTLHVSARDEGTGREKTLSIQGVGVRGKLVPTMMEVEKMAQQGEKHKSEDEEFLKKVNAMHAMKEYAIKVRENAASGSYFKKAHLAFSDVVEKVLDEFKEQAKEFGSESSDVVN